MVGTLGVLGDRINRRWLLTGGIAALVLADLVLAAAPSWPIVLLGSAAWGLHMAATPGLLSAMVADTAPEDLRGSAFGAFNLMQGVAVLLGSALAGLIWEIAGSPVTFLTGAILALLCLPFLAPSKAVS